MLILRILVFFGLIAVWIVLLDLSRGVRAFEVGQMIGGASIGALLWVGAEAITKRIALAWNRS